MEKVPLLWVGIICCGILAVLFFFGPYLPKVDKHVSTHSYIIGPDGHLDFILPPFHPSMRFPFGGDRSGRDLYSAMIMGTRNTLTIVGMITMVTFLSHSHLG